MANTGVSGSGADQQQASHRSEAQFHEIADAAPAMLWITEADGRCSFLSRGWYDFTGQSEAEALGFGWLDALHPDDHASAGEAFATANREQRAFSLDYRFRRHDGEYRWAIDAGRPRHDAEGRFCGFVGSVIDIDDRKRATEALVRSEARYRALFDSIDEGFCVIEVLFDDGGRASDYRFVEVNPSFERQTGLHAPVGRTARELVPDLEDRWFELYGAVALTGEPQRFVEGSDAMHRWFDVYAFRLGAAADRRVAVLFNDISARKRIEDALRQADQRKDEFLATLAHELRNPLAPIRTSLQVLRLSDDADTVQRMHAIVERQVDQMTRLVDDLMEVSRITRGRIELRKTLVDLGAVVRNAVETSAPLFAQAGHVLDVSLPNEALRVHADPVRLAQVFTNLLNNAARYSEPGSRVTLQARHDGEEVVVAVRDDGIGIAPDKIARIFDLFTQLDRSAGRSQAGLGIGLALVRSLVDMHGGSVEARSDGLGKGSEFAVRLPLPDTGALAPAPRSPNAPKGALHGLKVLVVDDNDDAAESFAEWLSHFGAQARVAGDGEAALSAMEGHAPDVVLLDLGMPGIDGFEVAQRIRAQPRFGDTTLIAITGWGQPAVRERTAAAGFDHHMTKPPDIPALKTMLLSINADRMRRERAARGQRE